MIHNFEVSYIMHVSHFTKRYKILLLYTFVQNITKKFEFDLQNLK